MYAGPPTDPRAIVDDPNLRWEDLNTAITLGYGGLAGRTQALLDPVCAATGMSDQRPAWFLMAVWASREVGLCQVAAGQTLRRLQALGPADDAMDALVPYLPSPVRGVLTGLFGDDDELAASAALMLSVSHDEDDPSDMPGNLSAFLDPRTLAISANRMVGLLRDAPGEGLAGRLTSVCHTVRNVLEDGNRRIYGDIGTAAWAWLRWRADEGEVYPDAVLDGFHLPGSPGPRVARGIHDGVLGQVLRGTIPRRFDAWPGPDSAGSLAHVIAAFALYEEAAITGQAALRDALVAAANNLLAWREQYIAVQPAFTPADILPGEVHRPTLFRALTPTVRLPVGRALWNFRDFVSTLEARDLNPLTPRVTEYCWATFEDRWPGILDAFEAAYRDPAGGWPLPEPDPRTRNRR